MRRREKGFKHGKSTRIKATNIQIPGAQLDPAFTKKLMVAGQHTAARSCDTKARFASLAHATKAEKDIAAKYNDGQRHSVYPCAYCGGFHFAAIRP